MDDQSSKSKMGGGAVVFVLIAFPLWREFEEPGQPLWNIILAVMLAGLLAAAYFLQRYFREHIGEIGEARFDTRSNVEPDA